MLITDYYKIPVFNKLKNKFLKENFSDFSTEYIHNYLFSIKSKI
jgi:hypothetical protein